MTNFSTTGEGGSINYSFGPLTVKEITDPKRSDKNGKMYCQMKVVQEVVSSYSGGSNSGGFALAGLLGATTPVEYKNERSHSATFEAEKLNQLGITIGKELEAGDQKLIIQRTRFAEPQSENHKAGGDGCYYTTTIITEDQMRKFIKKNNAIDVNTCPGIVRQGEAAKSSANIGEIINS